MAKKNATKTRRPAATSEQPRDTRTVAQILDMAAEDVDGLVTIATDAIEAILTGRLGDYDDEDKTADDKLRRALGALDCINRDLGRYLDDAKAKVRA